MSEQIFIAEVWATTYTGANFRGFADSNDNVDVKMKLIGKEKDIVVFLIDKFLWPDDSITTFSSLKKGIKSQSVIMYDGCGAVVKMKVDGVKLFDVHSDYDDCKLKNFENVGNVIVTKLGKDSLSHKVLGF